MEGAGVQNCLTELISILIGTEKLEMFCNVTETKITSRVFIVEIYSSKL